MAYYLHEIYFYFKIQSIVTAKSDQDPDPLGTAFVGLVDQVPDRH